ncbi:DUF397 domain-containing protein [Streptomyces sp. NPDC102360]|uniref:DUF397 domain-containing protein n=1 Tax=Streptomyces sp. NPDC102360 TaxID=3366160 RepID=UPI0037F7A9EA
MTDALPAGIPDDLAWQRAAPEDANGSGPWIEIAYGDSELVYLRETSAPDTVVTTTRTKWEAFARGIQAGEFDHFVDGV